MKRLVFVIILMSYSLVHGQSDKDAKPSWSEKMPERQSRPGLNIDSDIDTTIELDLGDFSMGRDDVDEEEDNSGRSDLQKLEDEKKIIEEKITEQKRLATIKAKRDKKQEEQRIVEEQERAKQQAEELRLAEKRAEENKLADEKKAEEALANQEDKTNSNSADNASTTPAQADTIPDPVVTDTIPVPVETDIALTETTEADTESTPEQIDTTPVQTETITANTYSWKKIKNVLPVYPSQAARNDREGWVEIELEIDLNGVVVDANVTKTSRNYKAFNKSALKAVKKWRYEPPSNVGITANQTRTVKLIFRL